jgi:hypothetical protein
VGHMGADRIRPDRRVRQSEGAVPGAGCISG